jgi:hypothetical protein
MLSMVSARWCAPLLALTSVIAACKDDGGDGTAEASTTSDDGTGSTSLVPTTNVTATMSDTGVVDGSSGGPDDGGGQCSIYEQDCAAGEKCVPWSDQPDLVPDDIRCCAIEGEPKEIGDPCTINGYFGSCLDDCNVGSFCLDPFNTGQGTCQKFCTGSASNPTCDPNESCLIYFAGVPMCFEQCDPLLQACGEGMGCYPDEEAAGGTGFICLPTIAGDGTYGELCWLLSGCAPGFICVYSDFLPDCIGSVGCCTALCDVMEADSCTDFNPDIECVSWYYAGQEPPSAQLQNVGVCALPPP